MDRSNGLDRLGLHANATVEESRLRYEQLRIELEMFIADAPTAALKSKYQSELRTLKEAFDAVCPSTEDEADFPVAEPVMDQPPILTDVRSSGAGQFVSQTMNAVQPPPAKEPRKPSNIKWGRLLVRLAIACLFVGLAIWVWRYEQQVRAAARQAEVDAKQAEADRVAEAAREAASADAARRDDEAKAATQAETARVETARAEASRAEAAREEAAHEEAARAEAARAEAAKAEAAKADAAKAEAVARAEEARAQAARAEAARQQASDAAEEKRKAQEDEEKSEHADAMVKACVRRYQQSCMKDCLSGKYNIPPPQCSSLYCNKDEGTNTEWEDKCEARYKP